MMLTVAGPSFPEPHNVDRDGTDSWRSEHSRYKAATDGVVPVFRNPQVSAERNENLGQ